MFRGSARTRASMRRHEQNHIHKDREQTNEDTTELPSHAEEKRKSDESSERELPKLEKQKSVTYAKQFESPSSKVESDVESTEEEEESGDVIILPKFKPEKDKKRLIKEEEFKQIVHKRNRMTEFPQDWDVIALKREPKNQQDQWLPPNYLDAAVERMLRADTMSMECKMAFNSEV